MKYHMLILQHTSNRTENDIVFIPNLKLRIEVESCLKNNGIHTGVGPHLGAEKVVHPLITHVQ